MLGWQVIDSLCAAEFGIFRCVDALRALWGFAGGGSESGNCLQGTWPFYEGFPGCLHVIGENVVRGAPIECLPCAHPAQATGKV